MEDTSPAYEQTETEKQTRAEARQARADRIRERIAAVQAELKEELYGVTARRAAARMDDPGELPLTRRYELFREAVRATVLSEAPDATVIVDKLEQYDAMVELSHGGETVRGSERGALRHPTLSGSSLASALVRELQKKLGRRATGAE